MTLDEAIDALERNAMRPAQIRAAILAIARAVKAMQPCDHEWAVIDPTTVKCKKCQIYRMLLSS